MLAACYGWRESPWDWGRCQQVSVLGIGPRRSRSAAEVPALVHSGIYYL
jgi:hypothetical protein